MDLCSRSELTEPGTQSVASMVGSRLGGRLHLGRVSAKGPNGTEPPEVAPVDGSDVVKVPESSRAWRYSPQVTLDAANGYHLEAKP